MRLRKGSTQRTPRCHIIPISGPPIDRPPGPLRPPPRIFCKPSMPRLPIIMPQLGESIAEATIINFLAKAGDSVENDQDVLEVETNKATMNVSSPARGKIEQWLVQRDESYAVGDVLG